MNEQVSDLASKINILEKRVDDLKDYLLVSFGVGATIFAVVAIVFAWNFSDERQTLREFQQNTKEEVKRRLDRYGDEPKLILTTTDGKDLEKAIVRYEVKLYPKKSSETKEGNEQQRSEVKKIGFSIFLRNEGEIDAGRIASRLYVESPLDLFRTSEEDEYSTADYWSPSELGGIQNLPGGALTEHSIRIPVKEGKELDPKAEYKILAKYYYGTGKITQAEFYLKRKGKGARLN